MKKRSDKNRHPQGPKDVHSSKMHHRLFGELSVSVKPICSGCKLIKAQNAELALYDKMITVKTFFFLSL